MRARKVGLTTCVALVAAIIGIAAVSSAAPAPQTLTLACALKGNGLLKVVTGTNQCPSKQGTLVTFSVASPVSLCRQRDGSVRQIPARDCTKASGTMFTVPSNMPAYFCANLTTGGVLRYVTDPSLCTSAESTFDIVNHAPTDIELSTASIAENTAGGAVIGTFSATDPDAGDSATFALVLDAVDNASFTIAGNQLKNAMAFDYETKSSYTIRVRATDLLGLTYVEDFTITVTNVDEAPDVDNSSGALPYTENEPPTAIDTSITITDPDSTNLTGATVQITGNYSSPQDVLALPAQPNITATYSTGTLTLSGTATIAAYETALEAVTYVNTSDNPSTVTRTVTYTARDAGGFGTPDTHAVTVTAVDDTPVALDNSATVAEDAVATVVNVLANDTDVDDGPKSITSVTQPANGTVFNNGTDLTYAPNANYCNSPPGTTPDTFTYSLNGGSTATVSMTVTCSDDPPSAFDDSATVTANSGATLIFVLTNDADVDGGPIAIASVTQPANGTVSNNGTDVSYMPNASYCNSSSGAPDTFTYTLSPGGRTATVSVTVTCPAQPPDVTTSGGQLAYTENDEATPIDPDLTVVDPDAGAMITAATVAITANFAGVQDVLELAFPPFGIMVVAQAGNTLTLSGTATPAAYQAALRAVTYRNTSEGPSTLTRTATFTVTDDTALSDAATRGISVATQNDPPTAVDDSGVTDEDTPLSVSAPGVLANDTDVDPGDTKTVVALNGTGTLTQTLPSGASVTINANGSYTYNPLAAFQGLSTGQTASDSFTYTMQDGAGAQDTATVNLTINGISDARWRSPTRSTRSATPACSSARSGPRRRRARRSRGRCSRTTPIPTRLRVSSRSPRRRPPSSAGRSRSRRTATSRITPNTLTSAFRIRSRTP